MERITDVDGIFLFLWYEIVIAVLVLVVVLAWVDRSKGD